MNHEIACRMTALSEGQRREREELFRGLAGRIQRVTETEHGYRFDFGTNPEIWADTARFVDLERRCCPFFHFTLQRDPQDRILLSLSGPPGTREFLSNLLNEQRGDV